MITDQTTHSLGIDTTGDIILGITKTWVKVAESLVGDLEETKSAHSMDCEQMQIFLLALLMNEINEDNKSQMPLLIMRQTGSMLMHML